MTEGWIKLYRQFTEWEWYSDANTMRLFLHCILLANHKNKKWQGRTIERGSFITSQPILAHSLKLSIQNIRTSLNKLKLTGELTVKTTADYSIITVNNYNLFQIDDRLTNSLSTDYQQATNSLLTTTNNDKNEKNEKNERISFFKKDPYINPTKKFLIEEYERIFNTKVFLSNQDHLRLVELSSEHSDICELITLALTKLKDINFEDINFKPSVNWLLKGNNFERVLNGEFDKVETAEEKKRREMEEVKQKMIAEGKW